MTDLADPDDPPPEWMVWRKPDGWWALLRRGEHIPSLHSSKESALRYVEQFETRNR